MLYLIISYADADSCVRRRYCRRSRLAEASKKCVVSATCCEDIVCYAVLAFHTVNDLEHDAAEMSYVGQQTDGQINLTQHQRQ